MRPQPGTWPATQACALDWESNWQPFDSQASTQSTEPHQPGHEFLDITPKAQHKKEKKKTYVGFC